jgi:hypothetical protein
VLLIPEERTPGYYAATAPYDELSGGVTGTSQSVIDLYLGLSRWFMSQT